MLLRLSEEGSHRLHGDLCGQPVGKMKLARGDAAERDAFDMALLRQRQAGAIAGGQQALVCLRHAARDDGTDRMEHIPAGQIERGRQFCQPGFFIVPLSPHQLGAGKPQLNAGIRMDTVPYP